MIILEDQVNFFIKGFKKIYDMASDTSPAKVLVSGFLAIILTGTFLLALPIASRNGESVGLLNALFTSTSAVCVTGLVVVNTYAHWTFFGQLVILLLIQVGGLGFMSMITAVFLFFKRKITLKDRILIKEAYNQDRLGGMVKLVMNVIKGTLIIEGVCAFLLSIIFIEKGAGFFQGIWQGIFISISAFCNAGFDNIGSSSLMAYKSNLFVNLIVMFLITAGGIGFAVWFDLQNVSKVWKKEISLKLFLRRLSLHTKIVLISSTILVLVGALFTFVVEYNNPATLGYLPLETKVLASFFQSVTLRTAGFNTIDISQASNSTQFFYILEMFIGGSPGGTAGGVKTVTISVIFIAIISALKGRNKMVVFNRHLKDEVLYKALAVIMLNISMVVFSTMILTLSEGDHSYRFIDYLFETASAVGTVGLTLGLTPDLTSIGKVVIICCMFFGRLGPITIALAFTSKSQGSSPINYPDENVLVG